MVQKENNFIYLFIALLFYLIGTPLIAEIWPSPDFQLQGFIFVVTLLIAIFSCATSQRMIYVGLALGSAALVAAVLASDRGVSLWDYVSILSFLAFLIMAIWVAGYQVFATFKPEVNQLVGAVCIYLLIGSIWSLLYALLYLIEPGAFTERTHLAANGASRDWVYFSFITLTTVGYGDITPVSPVARALTFLEAIVGQFYLAILVAGLVGSYLARKRGD